MALKNLMAKFQQLRDYGNGAHRIASCIALGKNVLSEESDISKGQIDCTANYFLNKKDIVKKVLREVMPMKWH